MKERFYSTAIRPVLFCGIERWDIKRHYSQKMNVVNMRMVRWMCVILERVRNEDIIAEE